MASEKGDLEMRRISGKLNEHFAFLNANGAAPDGTFLILYERSQVHWISAVFMVLDFLKNCSNLID